MGSFIFCDAGDRASSQSFRWSYICASLRDPTPLQRLPSSYQRLPRACPLEPWLCTATPWGPSHWGLGTDTQTTMRPTERHPQKPVFAHLALPFFSLETRVKALSVLSFLLCFLTSPDSLLCAPPLHGHATPPLLGACNCLITGLTTPESS